MNRLRQNTSNLLTILEVRSDAIDSLHDLPEWQAALDYLYKHSDCEWILWSQDLEQKQIVVLLTEWQDEYLRDHLLDLNALPACHHVWKKLKALLQSPPHSEIIYLKDGSCHLLNQLHELIILRGDWNLLAEAHLADAIKGMVMLSFPQGGCHGPPSHFLACAYGLMHTSQGVAQFSMLCTWASTHHRTEFQDPMQDTPGGATLWEDHIAQSFRDLRASSVTYSSFLLCLQSWPPTPEKQERPPRGPCCVLF